MSLVPFARQVARRGAGPALAERFLRGVNSEYGKFIRKENQKEAKYLKKKKKAPKSKAVTATMSLSNGSGQSMTMTKRKAPSRKVVPLKTRIQKLEKKVGQNLSTHVFRDETTLQVSSLVGLCGYGEAQLTGAAQIETMLDAIPYVAPASPSTSQQSQFQLIPQPTKWNISFSGGVIMRNNYLYPVNVRCYVLQPKIDASVVSYTAVTTGITTKANPAVYSTTAPWSFPSDSKQFTDSFKIIKSCDMKLQSGDECVINHSESFVYDQEIRDTHTDTYLRKYSRLVMIRVVGVVCHDSVTTTNISIAPTKLDCVVHRKYTLRHPTEAPIQTLEIASGLAAVTTAVVGVASAETESAL